MPGSHRTQDQRRVVERGFCCWCGEALLVTEDGLAWARDNLKPEDAVFRCSLGDAWPRVKSWHPWCVVAFMLRNNPGMTRTYVYRRDRGKCALDCDRSMFGGWEADHIVPLADGGSFEMENLQTLCRQHHRDKTAREATARAARRKGA